MKAFKNWILLFFKGGFMGIGNVIPGVSGGTLAVILGIYDSLIDAISSLFKKFKENILFLFPVLLGMLVFIVLSSKGIDLALEHFPLATVLFFVGMILGGIPLLFQKVKTGLKNVWNYLIFALIFVLLLLYTFLNPRSGAVEINQFGFLEYFLLFCVGMIGAATMIIPGISGSMTLMVLGYYDLIVLESVGNIMDFSKIGYHLQVLIPFGLGCIVGLLLIAKLLSFLLKKFETKTYFGIFGFIFASLIIIFYLNVSTFSVGEFFIGLFLGVFGFFLSYFISIGKIKIGKFEPFKKKEKQEITEEKTHEM